jgi:hypothetical protein
VPRRFNVIAASDPPKPALIHHHDDLAERLAVSQPGDRFTRLREGKTFRDARPDRALFVEIDKFGHIARMALRIPSDEIAPEDADDFTALEQSENERDFRDPRRKSDDKKTPLSGDRPQGRFGIIAPNRIVDDVRATRAACGFEMIREFLRSLFIESSARIDDAGVGSPLVSSWHPWAAREARSTLRAAPG